MSSPEEQGREQPGAADERILTFRVEAVSVILGLSVLLTGLRAVFTESEPLWFQWVLPVVNTVAFTTWLFVRWFIDGDFLYHGGKRLSPDARRECEGTLRRNAVYDTRKLVEAKRGGGELKLLFSDGRKVNIPILFMFPMTRKRLQKELNAIIAKNQAAGLGQGGQP